MDDTALRFKFSLDPKMWLWSLRFLANCTAARNRANTLVKLGLCISIPGTFLRRRSRSYRPFRWRIFAPPFSGFGGYLGNVGKIGPRMLLLTRRTTTNREGRRWPRS